MRFFIFTLFVVTMLFGADVDTKLYDNAQKESYYEEIKNQILSDEKGNKKSIEIIKEEKLYLQRVRSEIGRAHV